MIFQNNYQKHLKLEKAYNEKYYQPDQLGVISRNTAKLIAIYLPQFHPFPENNRAWGKGFTEWTNVASSVPRFVGHHQPYLPSELGFYDLRIPGKLKEQVELAKQYGLYGFDFYYYWFSGKKIMDMPIETFLADKSIDFNFSLTWANENWARTWDAKPKEVIIPQNYRKEDPLKFIKDVEKFLLDERYIKILGKPLLTIYRPNDIPDVKRWIEVWQRYWRKAHGTDLYIAVVTNFGRPVELGLQGMVEERSFLPLNSWLFFPEQYEVDVKKKDLLDKNFSGVIKDMRKIYSRYIDNFLESDDTRFKCLSTAWDNQARRKGIKGLTFINSSPELYGRTLEKILEREIRHRGAGDAYVYVNAWNEWAEGAALEPSQNLGYANLIATREALINSEKS